MAYITLAYYTDTYFGVSAGSDFNRLAARASDDIDIATMHGIVEADLTAAELAMVQKATCAQVEYYVQNGDTYNEPETAGSEQIGSFQRSTGYQQRKSPTALCPRAAAYLEQSGLMGRGVANLVDGIPGDDNE